MRGELRNEKQEYQSACIGRVLCGIGIVVPMLMPKIVIGRSRLRWPAMWLFLLRCSYRRSWPQ